MNITFFIGNGFDLNLGLRTTYLDFLETYIKSISLDSKISGFKEKIIKDLPLWANAEKAFGEYTIKFTDADDFLDCHMHFCQKLGEYLEEQESRISIEMQEETLPQLFADSLSTINFSTTALDSRKNSYAVLNFVVFNYTRIIDKCIYYLQTEYEDYGEEGLDITIDGSSYRGFFGKIYHIHGYTDKKMVLGVNDESQISNPDLFLGKDDEYMCQIIKQKTNQIIHAEQMDEKCRDLLDESDLVYIYGMSLGETDILWWERIYRWLKKDINHQLVIHKFDAPEEEFIPTRFRIFEREILEEFVGYSNVKLTPDTRKQIRVTKNNFFLPMKDLINIQLESTSETILV